MNDWSDEWPTENGFYWFYGYLWNNIQPRLISVEVKVTKNSIVYIALGSFIYRSDGDCRGKWIKAIIQELPDIN